MKKSNNNPRTTKIYVKGMHCASCELLIQKTIADYPDVKRVDANLEKGEVVIKSDIDFSKKIEKLNSEFKDSGYTFSMTKINHKQTRLFSIQEGKLLVDKDKMNETLNILGIIALILVLVVLISNSSIGRYAGVDANSALPAFILLGLAASFSSCAALVGGLLLAMTKQWNDLYITDRTNKLKSRPHIFFHLGRFIGFIVFGGILGAVGSAISISNTVFFAVLVLAVSMVMILLALQMLGVNSVAGFTLSAPKFTTKFVTNESNFSGKFGPLLLGAFTFLLPCGFTLVAQTAALASASIVNGALIMLLFSIGTFPVLAGISLTGLKFNSRPKLTAIFNKAAGILIIIFAIYTINSQLNILGVKSLNDIKFGTREVNIEEESQPNIDENVQKITVVAEGFRYQQIGSTTIKAGEKTVLAVNNRGIQGCGKFMAARGLFDNYVELKPGWNYVEFTPKVGTYKLTCTMGMVPPLTITVI